VGTTDLLKAARLETSLAIHAEPDPEHLEVIDTLVEAERILLSAQTVMRASSLADRPGYESIDERIGAALASARSALAEAHHKLHGL
jgi:hypothetical protein